MASSTPLADALFPEWQPFRAAAAERHPTDGTACAAWTVHELVAHNAGNADELGRILAAHLEDDPVPRTRSFEDREQPYRALSAPDLLAALDTQVEGLARVVDAASSSDQSALVEWTGRKMQVRWFGEHLREELVLHRWDMTGDDATSLEQLSEAWVTAHSVAAVGRPLLARGLTLVGDDGPFTARLHVTGTDDVLVGVNADGGWIDLVEPEGPAVLCTDAAARVLLLWGRRPGDPGRIHSTAGPEALGRARRLLSGY